MPGVCPNCIKLVPEGESCPDCKGPLIPVSRWAREKDQFLPARTEFPAAGDAPASGGPVPNVSSPQGEPAEPRPRFYGLRFFLGMLAGVGAMIATIVLVFAIRGG